MATGHKLLVILLGFIAALSRAIAAESCSDTGLALQVLGSGGPIADDQRASTGYVVWIDGKSRLVVDAGGGTFVRFGESGAAFGELRFVGLSHFHTDHSADFPALLKSGYFSERTKPLPVAGPSAGGPFPGLNTFLNSMLNENRGAFGYLSGYLDGSDGLVEVLPVEVAPDGPERVFEEVIDGRAVTIDALHVPHGSVPTLAFRVSVDDTTVVFAGDQNGSKAAFTEFAKAAQMLVMHLAVPEGAAGNAVKLHARPSRIGEIAGNAGPDRLVLSHFMARSLQDLDGNIQVVSQAFEGEVHVAADLDCLRLYE